MADTLSPIQEKGDFIAREYPLKDLLVSGEFSNQDGHGTVSSAVLRKSQDLPRRKGDFAFRIGAANNPQALAQALYAATTIGLGIAACGKWLSVRPVLFQMLQDAAPGEAISFGFSGDILQGDFHAWHCGQTVLAAFHGSAGY